MQLEFLGPLAAIGALGTHEGLALYMHHGMFGEVVPQLEPLVTNIAGKLAQTGVLERLAAGEGRGKPLVVGHGWRLAQKGSSLRGGWKPKGRRRGRRNVPEGVRRGKRRVDSPLEEFLQMSTVLSEEAVSEEAFLAC